MAMLPFGHLQPSLLQQRNWFQRTFLDWYVPWWVEPLLYVVVFGGWIVCWYFTLLYGVKFTYEQVKSISVHVRTYACASLTGTNMVGCMVLQ